MRALLKHSLLAALLLGFPEEISTSRTDYRLEPLAKYVKSELLPI